jgi:hypothetical protein
VLHFLLELGHRKYADANVNDGNKREQGGKAGLNLAPWNGRSQFGEIVPNGVYLFKIVSLVFGQKKVIGSGKVIVLH